MRLIGYERSGGIWVGRLSGDGTQVTPVTSVEQFWQDPKRWSDAVDGESTVARDGLVERPLVPPAARIICIGLNYRAHAAEGSFAVPDYPTIFGRWTASLAVGGQPVAVPVGERGLDWEGEVAVYIGSEAREVDADAAADAIFGYSTFNDLTARRAQKLTAQWTLGKNADASGPMGPLVTKAEVGALGEGLELSTRVNGTEVQRGNTRDMIFSPEAIISLVSRTFTLKPGDVICSGTPEGVGYVRTPPWLLQPGDVVEVEIERLGTLVTPVVGRTS